MRPFTRVHQVLSALMPVGAGITGAGVLNLLVLEFHPGWLIAHGVGLVLLAAGLQARRHGRRRWTELRRRAHQRGWRHGLVEWDFFTESDVREMGLIHGKWLEQAVRELDAHHRGVQES